MPPRTRRKHTPTKVSLYKERIWHRRWFHKVVLVLLGCFVLGLLVTYLFIRHYSAEAAKFDLNDIYKLESASVIYDRNREEIGRIFVENRRPVTFDEVPFHLVQALIATEDSRFFEHGGVDYWGIARAMVRNVKAGGIKEGGSTVTQQLARKSFGLSGRSYTRKLVEAFLAVRLEKNFSKAQIMEFYLNRIYFGGGFYGVNAAAQGYFGKAASELLPEESATIVGLIKSPNRLSPLRNPEGSKDTRNLVFLRMRDEKMISNDEFEQLRNLPLKTNPGTSATTQESYVYEQVRKQVIEQIGSEKAQKGGFQIYTTIDSRIQETAENSILKHLALLEQRPGYEHQTYADYQELLYQLGDVEPKDRPAPTYLQGAALMIDNKTGAVIAMVGGRDYHDSEFNRTIQARRQPGTAFKPFVYATAFSQGLWPGSTVVDKPIDNRRVMIGGTEGILGEWGVERDGNVHEGDITARRALAQSKVAATVRVGEAAGLGAVIATAAKAGIESPMREFNATFLGASELFMDEFCRAFTIFPNQGTHPKDLYIIESIRDHLGEIVFEEKPENRTRVRCLDRIAAYQVHTCLEGVLDEGTGWRAREEFGLKDFDGGGKTGTAYNFTDNWFIGYDSEVTCAVWCGFDKPQTIFRGAFSNQTVLPIWVDVMNAALEEFPAKSIAPPEGLVAIELCDRSGMRATDSCFSQEVRDGKTINVRTTHLTHVRPEHVMTDFCPVHGEGGNTLGGAQFAALRLGAPRRDLGQDNNSRDKFPGFRPIPMQSPTVLGDDPFDAIAPVVRASVLEIIEEAPTDGEINPDTGEETIVARPQVLTTLEIGEEKFRIPLPPPEKLQFE
ncbi:MAG: transglycosylase domain-containing protein [Verrucomicrobiota bacterium]